MTYSEDDLREAFYKGREQACLPDEKATIIFIRPTFNGYLREFDGQQDPHEDFKTRVQSLINNRDYDLQQWKDHYELREMQRKYDMPNRKLERIIESLQVEEISRLKKMLSEL